jgi:DNA polymerase-3 subunit chi
VAEVLFYHLERRTLDDVLPGLVDKSLKRNWRVLIRTESADRAAAVDALLWTYSEQSFLPHAQLGDGESARQPVLISVEEENVNHAQILFLVGGAMLSRWETEPGLERIVLLFDGRDGDAVATARAGWRKAKEAGHDVTYWKETPGGKWEKQG